MDEQEYQAALAAEMAATKRRSRITLAVFGGLFLVALLVVARTCSEPTTNKVAAPAPPPRISYKVESWNWLLDDQQGSYWTFKFIVELKNTEKVSHQYALAVEWLAADKAVLKTSYVVDCYLLAGAKANFGGRELISSNMGQMIKQASLTVVEVK